MKIQFRLLKNKDFSKLLNRDDESTMKSAICIQKHKKILEQNILRKCRNKKDTRKYRKYRNAEIPAIKWNSIHLFCCIVTLA